MRNDRGAALLEAVTALVLLGVAGTAVVSMLLEASAAVARVQVRERTNLAAVRVLTAVSLLTREELAVRSGGRQVGEFIITARPMPKNLFRLGIALTAAPEQELLATLVLPPGSAATHGGER